MSEDIGNDLVIRDPDLDRIGGIMVCVSSIIYINGSSAAKPVRPS